MSPWESAGGSRDILLGSHPIPCHARRCSVTERVNQQSQPCRGLSHQTVFVTARTRGHALRGGEDTVGWTPHICKGNRVEVCHTRRSLSLRGHAGTLCEVVRTQSAGLRIYVKETVSRFVL